MRCEGFKTGLVCKEVYAQGTCGCCLTVGHFLLGFFRLAEHCADFLPVEEILSSVVLVILSIFLVAHAEKMPTLAEYAVVYPVRESCADSADGYVVHNKHHKHKNRQSRIPVCQNLVDFIRGRKLAFAVSAVTALDYCVYVVITLVGDNALSVVIELLLGILDILLDMLKDIFGNADA